MSETIYPAGIMIFPPNDNVPDFVRGTVIITIKVLADFCMANENLMTEYKGAKQLKCDLLMGKKGLYLKVNNYKKENESPFYHGEVTEF